MDRCIFFLKDGDLGGRVVLAGGRPFGILAWPPSFLVRLQTPTTNRKTFKNSLVHGTPDDVVAYC